MVASSLRRLMRLAYRARRVKCVKVEAGGLKRIVNLQESQGVRKGARDSPHSRDPLVFRPTDRRLQACLLCRQIADERQLEDLTLVRLDHQENPRHKDSQAQD